MGMAIRRARLEAELFLLVMTLLVPPAWGQSLEEAERLDRQVVEFYRQGQYKEAIPHLEQALKTFEAEGLSDGVKVVPGNLVLAYRFLGDHEKAGEYSNRLQRAE